MKAISPALVLSFTSVLAAASSLTSLPAGSLDGAWKVAQLKVPAGMALQHAPNPALGAGHRLYSLLRGDAFDHRGMPATIAGGATSLTLFDPVYGSEIFPAVFEGSGRLLVDGAVELYPNETPDVLVGAQLEQGLDEYVLRAAVKPFLGGTTATLAGTWRVTAVTAPSEMTLTEILPAPPGTAYELNGGAPGYFEGGHELVSITAGGDVVSGGSPTGQTVSLDAAGTITAGAETYFLAAAGDVLIGGNHDMFAAADDLRKLTVGVRPPATLAAGDLTGEWQAATLDLPRQVELVDLMTAGVFQDYDLLNEEIFQGNFASLSISGANFAATSPDGTVETGTFSLGPTTGELLASIPSSGRTFSVFPNARKNVFVAYFDDVGFRSLVIAVKLPATVCIPPAAAVALESPTSASVLIPAVAGVSHALEGSSNGVNWGPVPHTTSTVMEGGTELVRLRHNSTKPLPRAMLYRVRSRLAGP